MPTIFAVRRMLIAAGALAALAAPAAPASAHRHSAHKHFAAAAHASSLPCIAGIGCSAHAAAHESAACENTDLQPAIDNTAEVENATLCLINRRRAAHGRKRLHSNSILQGVAASYAHLMVVKSFFDHVAPSGSTFDQRIRDAGYLDGFSGWSIGENIAWGGGTEATPRSIVRAWMHSPEHRRNILDRHFHDAGLGVAIGLPVAGQSGATFVNEFGDRVR